MVCLLPLSHRLHKRQSPSTTSGIGTTAHLMGDNHNQAVVHWTGYPSENIFIITSARNSSAAGKQAHSRESWLWRWVTCQCKISWDSNMDGGLWPIHHFIVKWERVWHLLSREHDIMEQLSRTRKQTMFHIMTSCLVAPTIINLSCPAGQQTMVTVLLMRRSN